MQLLSRRGLISSQSLRDPLESGLMGLVLTYTKKVREALKSPASIGVDLLLLVGSRELSRRWRDGLVSATTADRSGPVVINLSLWALPRYTLVQPDARDRRIHTLAGFTLIYGTIAAHNHRAEKLMIPAFWTFCNRSRCSGSCQGWCWR